jgi:GTPase-activating protein SAC7
LNGSSKRIKELQVIFDSPDRYGKGLDWTGYTVHDAANILRRYLNQLPQPIVPLEFYERFRHPLRDHVSQALGDTEAAAHEFTNFDHDKAIATYQQLITELPPLNRQLLLYILDLLAVFASKSDVNLMTSANLSAIFQPGLLSHPDHDMSVQDYRLSQDVLIFLIDNQDSFLIGMSGTAADEKTVKEVQSGASPSRQPATPSKSTSLGRSASNASTSGEGRRLSGLRRNVSVSSKNSKTSSIAGPATPSSGVFSSGGAGVYRSNTLPSKKSPALSSTRFARGVDSPNTPVALSPGLVSPSARSTSPAKNSLTVPEAHSTSTSFTSQLPDQSSTSTTAPYGSAPPDQSKEHLLTNDANLQAVAAPDQHLSPPPKVRKVSGILSNLNVSGEKDGRQPNKLKKKRNPSSMHPSANSSAASLTHGEESPNEGTFRTPLMTPGAVAPSQTEHINTVATQLPNENTASSKKVEPISIPESDSVPKEEASTPKTPIRLEDAHQNSETTLRAKSPQHSVHSKSSITDLSEQDHNDEVKKPEKKRRWRFSHSGKRNGQTSGMTSQSPARVGSNAVAENSTSSVGSWHRSRKSISNDAQSGPLEPVPSIPASQFTGSDGSKNYQSDDPQDGKDEKKGFFGKMIAKVSHVREERKEREAEKERAKSPGRDTERSGSKHSLSAIANANEISSPPRPPILKETIPENEPIGQLDESEQQPNTVNSHIAEPVAVNHEATNSSTIATDVPQPEKPSAL